jgi:glycosyltransferase involved in cell wall biosynthesis
VLSPVETIEPRKRAAVLRRPEPLRLAVLADMLEERWPSMDLVATSLFNELTAQTELEIEPQLVRPRLWRVTGGWLRPSGQVPTVDRVVNRFWLYRRALPRAGHVDVFHIIDHSYGHLAHHLPAGRTIVTCHDVDAFADLLGRGDRQSSGLPAFLVKRLVTGIAEAAMVVCPSQATADALVEGGLVERSRLAVVQNGVDIGPMPRARVTELTRPLLGPESSDAEFLHVGSTIDRKRIDILLEVFARIHARFPRARLVRVGGPFTREQQEVAERLGVADHVLEMPSLERETLAALYHRATLLLATSEREGFGLPVAEALAAGTPVVATDLRVFREVAADAATYVALEDIDAWTSTVMALLAERREQPQAWWQRRSLARSRGSRFSWARYAREMADVYRQVCAGGRNR